MENKVRPIFKDLNIRIIFSVTLLTTIGVASITPAFPKMAHELNITTHHIGLLVTIFTLPGIILTPLLGMLADRHGRKKILVPSLLLFGLAGGSCALTSDFHILLILRFFQGVGAASLGSINVTLIGDLYTGNERTTAMGYNAAVRSSGTAIYPSIGGALAMLGWHYPFILPLAAIPLGLSVLFLLKNPEPEKKDSFSGYLKNIWKNVKNRQIIGLFLAGIITFIILYGSYLIYFPFLMYHSFGANSLTIGLVMSAMSLATIISSTQLGKLSQKYSTSTLLKTAFTLYGVAMLLIPLVHEFWQLFIPIIIFGLAHGLNIPSIQTMLARLAPMEYRAAFMSLNGMVLRIGQTLGPVIIGLIFSLWGIHGAFFAGAGFAGLMVILIFILIRS